MPDPAPDGVLPMFLRGVTAEKYGMKTGEGITDLVDSILLKKELIMEEIIGLGVMSDFEPAKKMISDYAGEELLFVIDQNQQYGEMFLLCFTEEAKEVFQSKVREEQEAIAAQKAAEEAAEAARIQAEHDRLNVVYEDKPVSAKEWISDTMDETSEEVNAQSTIHFIPYREPVCLEITRPKTQTSKKFSFYNRDAEVGGVAEFRSVKDPNFKQLKERDMGFQAAAPMVSSDAQTTWNRKVNKAIQYTSTGSASESTSTSTGTDMGTGMEEEKEKEDPLKNDDLFLFLEKATIATEKALQQNESVDIFNETFRIVGTDNTADQGAGNELKELKNFADPQYSKFKRIVAIDWVPDTQGMLAASAVRNISFDQRATVSGHVHTSHILIWDFRQLVKPTAVLSCTHEVLCFKFNKNNRNVLVGGCITGQVVLWNIEANLKAATRKNTRNNSGDDEDSNKLVAPYEMSSIDFSHKKPVSDIFWLPADTQINYRGQLVADEYLDGQQHQFVSVAGDGMICVWDTRYRQIAADDLKFIGRTKHVPIEKAQNKTDEPKIIWAPIFRATLKRTEGIGELSLNKVAYSGSLPKNVSEQRKPTIGGPGSGQGKEQKQIPTGDSRSHLILGTEEGDVISVDLCTGSSAAKAGGDDDKEDEAVPGVREFMHWCKLDHSRPAVSVKQSPFFPDLILTVSDWAFHIWEVGLDQPVYVSTNHANYLTCGEWSPTRPSVVILADASGHLIVWDFVDSSSRPSSEIKATHDRITSMEFLPEGGGRAPPSSNTKGSSGEGAASARPQLLAIGDESGTLHVVDMPRTVVRPVPREREIMSDFLKREWCRVEYVNTMPAIQGFEVRDAALAQAAAMASVPKASEEQMDIDFDEEEEIPTSAAVAPPGGGEGEDGNNGGGAVEAQPNAANERRKALREQLKKEEEEFLKLERMFVSELEIVDEDIPDAIRGSMAPFVETKK